VQHTLCNFLNVNPPPSLLECAKRAGISKSSIYKYDPDLCHAISARFLEYRKFHRLKASKKSGANHRRAA
jgi:hypothetical protein